MSRDIPIETWTAGAIPEADLIAACELERLAFAEPARTLAAVLDAARPVWTQAGPPPPPRRHVVCERRPNVSTRCLANASVLTRTLATATGPMTVLGLFDVATHPDVRGRGLGRAVVRSVFAAVDAGAAPFCLFQTGAARGFYEKLGCRRVTNRIVNRRAADGEANPFTDTFVMRYPQHTGGGAVAWPAGVIDLNGPGY